MLFNSLEFALFLAVVLGLYHALPRRGQNRMLLVATYVFYGSWDWRFLTLIWISTGLDYYAGLKIRETTDIRKKKYFVALSILGNLGILGFFKYFNFFAENFQALFGVFGITVQPVFLNIILPVGISFYTFQTMSYSLDIYRGRLEPTTRFFDFALYVAFFPQLVAGPIERARKLLPQVLKPRTVNLESVFQGSYLILWGLFQKIFIADNLAKIADPLYAAAGPLTGLEVLLAGYTFAFQVYCDFAGYSNIAIGLAKCMGFTLMRNFNLPFFSTNTTEFWQRWHISLSTWFRDYVYAPLGGGKKGEGVAYRNLMTIMLLVGLWHGAAWTFVIWGASQGAALIVHRACRPWLHRLPPPPTLLAKKLWKAARIVLYFQFFAVTVILFRAQSVAQIGDMYQSLFFNFSPDLPGALLKDYARFFLLIAPIVLIEWTEYLKDNLYFVFKMPWWARSALYFTLIFLMMILGQGGGNEFIYFQF